VELNEDVVGHLSPAQRQRLERALERSQKLCAVFRARRTLGQSVDYLGPQLKQVGDAIDAILPPTGEELAQRRLDVKARLAVEEAKRTIASTGRFLRNVAYVPERYRRVAEHVARFATKRLSDHHAPPRVVFFQRERYTLGLKEYATVGKHYDGHGVIHVALGLDDEELVRVVCHECSHFVNDPIDRTEARAERDERRLTKAYMQDYGRDLPGGGWVAAA
jgi:hypothetical protein